MVKRRAPEAATKMEEPLRLLIGQRLKEMLEAEGLTPYKIAKRIGMSVNSANMFYAYFNGTKNISTSRLLHILIQLGISPSEFFSVFTLEDTLGRIYETDDTFNAEIIDQEDRANSFY